MRLTRTIAAALFFLPVICLPAYPQKNVSIPDYKNPKLSAEKRTADLLKKMTLEEKAAQTQALWQMKKLIMDDKGDFSVEKATEVLKYGIGQITRANEKKSGPKEGAVFANDIQRFLVEKTRLGIPAMVHEEALHGHMSKKGTSFPQAIALAGTWEPELLERVFSAVAQELRARGAQQVLAPVLDVARDARWGRVEETYGEDPYLVSRMGVACIRGYQGTGPVIDSKHVIATVKHFAAHGQPEAGVNIAPANYSERIIREVFLAPFKSAVTEAGVLSLMASYNEINGMPSHANKWLLDSVLRKEWGFKGFVVADYNGINELCEIHKIAADKEEAAKKALEAGVDIELPDITVYQTLVQQIKEGKISESVLDKTVSRILYAKFLTGLFENPYVDPEYAEKITNSPGHQALALEAAKKAIVLLKNKNNLLPLDINKIGSIAVMGPNAEGCHLGEYSDDPGRCVSVLDGIKVKAGNKIKVNYAEGSRITEGDSDWRGWYLDEVKLSGSAENERRIAEAVETAKASDAVLLVLGENEKTSREAWGAEHLGDRDSLELLGMQNELVKAVLGTGKPVIALILGGRPLSINYIAENVPAILEGWFLGQEGGTAVADVIFGDYNPGGKLTITFPRSVGQIPVFYNHKPSAKRGYLLADKSPLFSFGYGLSYTTFKIDNLRLSKSRIKADEKTVLKVDVANTGARKGDEVVQMYIRDKVSSVTRPVKELKGFKRVTLEPGRTQTVEFNITPDTLSFLDENMKETVEPGAFDIMAGPNSVDLQTVSLEVVK